MRLLKFIKNITLNLLVLIQLKIIRLFLANVYYYKDGENHKINIRKQPFFPSVLISIGDEGQEINFVNKDKKQ